MSEKLALSIREACDVLGVSRSYMYQLIHVEGFPALKIGNRVLISISDLQTWLSEQAKGVI